jgi:hypothetical protein
MQKVLGLTLSTAKKKKKITIGQYNDSESKKRHK